MNSRIPEHSHVTESFAAALSVAPCAPLITTWGAMREHAEPDTAPPGTVNAQMLNAYKRDAARHILEANLESVAGTLPSILESIVMLDLTVDRDGEPVSVGVRPSNAHKALEQAALYSVYRARPLPPPSQEVLNGAGTVSYVEIWLFRADGRFQLDTVAAEPGPVAHSVGAADPVAKAAAIVEIT